MLENYYRFLYPSTCLVYGLLCIQNIKSDVSFPGCRGAIVVAEARSADDSALTRRCVIMKLPDFTVERYLEAKRQNAAAVLILLPKNISTVPEDVIQVLADALSFTITIS